MSPGAPIRVAVVEPTGQGGMAHYAFQLSQGLAAAGCAVTLLTARRFELARLPRAFQLDACLRLWDGRVVAPAGGLERLARRAWRALVHYREWGRLVLRLRRLRPDVVQLGDLRFAGDALCVGLLAALGFRLADVCHNIERFTAAGGFASSRLERLLYGWLYRRCRLVFVHYETNRARFLALYGLEPRRVVAVPHGNEAVFASLRRPGLTAADLRWRLRVPAEAPVILQLGSLSRYKGCELAVEALALVRLVVPAAHLVIAGRALPDFDLRGLEARIQALDLGPHVTVVPEYVRNDEVAAWLEFAGVAVFPYHEVFQSGALALAQTFGVPCVAADVGAMTEAAGDGALLVGAPPTPTALAAALTRVLTEPELARRLAAAGRRRAASEGDWTAIGARIAREYEALLEPAGGMIAAGTRAAEGRPASLPDRDPRLEARR